MKFFRPAEVFPPGEHLREELEACGWKQSYLARIIGRPLQMVNEIINGRKRITAETAKEIGLALGTSAEVWINLQVSYDLWHSKDPDAKIAKRAAAMSGAR